MGANSYQSFKQRKREVTKFFVKPFVLTLITYQLAEKALRCWKTLLCGFWPDLKIQKRKGLENWN